MARKLPKPTFDQTLDTLRAHAFEVVPYAGASGGTLVSKHGVAAVLTAGGKDKPVTVAIAPGVLVRGEVARLLDRGYQKFIKSSKFELPATAAQLQAIHVFSEQLKLLSGGESLYNESLGTTSDLYQYDRLKGREEVEIAAARPWDSTGGH
jgi:hypothetical protein